MDAEIVCISDDEEVEEEIIEPATKPKQTFFNFNVYDWSYVKRAPDPIDVDKPASSQESVVYVPDDVEEEKLLIGPIRRISRQILFGDQLSGPSPEFPHKLLLQLEKHLASSLRNVSFTTETNVWKSTLEQLSCAKIVYGDIADVSVFFYFPINTWKYA